MQGWGSGVRNEIDSKMKTSNIINLTTYSGFVKIYQKPSKSKKNSLIENLKNNKL